MLGKVVACIMLHCIQEKTDAFPIPTNLSFALRYLRRAIVRMMDD